MTKNEIIQQAERMAYREIFGEALCQNCGYVWNKHSEVGDSCPSGNWYSSTSRFEIYLPDDFQ